MLHEAPKFAFFVKNDLITWSAFLDIWNMLLDIFQDFDFLKNNRFWKPEISLWHSFPIYYLFKISLWHCFPIYYSFKISFWHCFPVYYSFKVSLWHCFPVYYLFKIFLCHGFRVPPTTPWSMCLPAALRRPQKNHVPGILEHAFCEFCGFCDFWVILRSRGKIFIIWPIWSNDYASKTRIEILCKKDVLRGSQSFF